MRGGREEGGGRSGRKRGGREEMMSNSVYGRVNASKTYVCNVCTYYRWEKKIPAIFNESCCANK